MCSCACSTPLRDNAAKRTTVTPMHGIHGNGSSMTSPRTFRDPMPSHPMRLRVLLVVRHPVGGIRTFLRYVYTRFDPALHEVSLLLPECSENEAIRSDLSSLSPTYFSLPANATPVQYIVSLVRAIRSVDPDVIHSQGLTSGQ